MALAWIASQRTATHTNRISGDGNDMVPQIVSWLVYIINYNQTLCGVFFIIAKCQIYQSISIKIGWQVIIDALKLTSATNNIIYTMLGIVSLLFNYKFIGNRSLNTTTQ